MAKGRHQKDKLYLIHTELRSSKSRGAGDAGTVLPFNYCSLSWLPFAKGDNVLVDAAGHLFEARNLELWLKRFACDPVTGESAQRADFADCRFFYNDQGDICCPVTYEVFNEHSRIVVNRRTGTIYSAQAIEELCRKPKCWVDPLDGSPISPRTDLVAVQHHARTTAAFDFVKKNVDWRRILQEASGQTTGPAECAPSVKRILDQVQTEELEQKTEQLLKRRRRDDNDWYVDPVSGKEFKVHDRLESARTGDTTSTVAQRTEDTRETQMKALSSRAFRTHMYAWLRRAGRSDMPITFRLTSGLKVKCLFNVHKAPESCHQVYINAAKEQYGRIEYLADGAGPLVTPALGIAGHRHAWRDVDAESSTAEYVAKGAVFVASRTLDGLGADAECSLVIALQGGVYDAAEPIVSLGTCVNISELSASCAGSVASTYVHHNPFAAAELKVVESMNQKRR